MTIRSKLTVHCPSSQGMLSILEVTYLNPSLGRPLGYSLLEMADSFHFLSVRHHIEFKLAVLIYKALTGLSPQYVVDNYQLTTTTGRRRL